MFAKIIKFICVIIAIGLVTTNVPARASDLDNDFVLGDSNSKDNAILIADKTKYIIKKYAEGLAGKIRPDIEINSGELIPIYDNENDIIGYSVSYYYQNTPYGYVNFDFRYSNPMVEFVVNKNSLSCYENIVNNITKTDDSYSSLSDEMHKLYKVAPFLYYSCFQDKNKNEIYVGRGNNQTRLSKEKFKKLQEKNRYDNNIDKVTKYEGFENIFQDNYNGTLYVIPRYLSKYSDARSLVSEDRIENSTNKYACSIAALTAIAYQEKINKSTLADTFNTLWSKTFTSVESVNDDITYGSTNRDNLGIGMKSYAIDQGKKNTTFSTETNPTTEFFTNAVENNYSSTLSMTIRTMDGEVGHCVSVVGYCRSMVADTGTTYLIVADGWYDNAPVYINYNNYNFQSTYGVVYKIK